LLLIVCYKTKRYLAARVITAQYSELADLTFHGRKLYPPEILYAF
jgi:hypothetical protein